MTASRRHHAVRRGTKDIDIVPDPRVDNLGRLAGALRALGAEVMLADDFDPSELGIAPDVAGAGSYDALRAAAVEREVPSAGPFLFAGLDDLIAMKVAAGRPQDELDITSLQRARSPRDA